MKMLYVITDQEVKFDPEFYHEYSVTEDWFFKRLKSCDVHGGLKQSNRVETDEIKEFLDGKVKLSKTNRRLPNMFGKVYQTHLIFRIDNSGETMKFSEISCTEPVRLAGWMMQELRMEKSIDNRDLCLEYTRPLVDSGRFDLPQQSSELLEEAVNGFQKAAAA